jgi:Histidine kinase-, DNA gyrase B-, and HSP90-like ATPase
LLIKTERGEVDEVRVALQDSGVGLDPKMEEQIFDAFFTTKPAGLGMGLSISRSIVENHGGRLWAVPNDGPGVTFQFTLQGGDGYRLYRPFRAVAFLYRYPGLKPWAESFRSFGAETKKSRLFVRSTIRPLPSVAPK